jgi:hypothetical protein
MTRKLWEWVSGDIDSAAYARVRVLVAVAGVIQIALLAGTHAPSVLVARTPSHSLRPDTTWWWASLALGALAAVSLGLGVRTRTSAGVLCLCLILGRATMTNWAGSVVIATAGVLVFAPSAGAWALQAKLVAAPAWPLRLIQLQLPVGYVLAVAAKLGLSPEWRTLTAFAHFSGHPTFTHSGFAVNPAWSPALSAAGLVAEAGAGLLLGIGLCGRARARNAGLALSAAFHTGIAVFVAVGMFPIAVAVLWVSHLDPPATGRQSTRWLVGGFTCLVVAAAAWAVALHPFNPFAVIG